jgi:RNAse (barnase) inhibitor barstar
MALIAWPINRSTARLVQCGPLIEIDNLSTTVQNAFLMRYEIDGSRFRTLEGFFDEVSRVIVPGQPWGHSLDAFDDILRGGFGTPPDGFTINWTNHAVSKQRLSYDETIRQLEIRLHRCHPSSRDTVLADLAGAKAQRGPTVFNWITDVIRRHGPGGVEQQDGVELVLD